MNRSRIVTLITVVVLAVAGYFGVGPDGTPVSGPVAENSRSAASSATKAVISTDELPVEARRVITLIREGGPFPYDKDGTVFGNRERLLPLKERGYYREYTVPTPGARTRGARRIVAGGPRTRPNAMYYTADHYASFRLIEEDVR